MPSKRVTPKFEEYKDRYENISLEREDGILTLTFHTDGDSMIWTGVAHDELGYCFTDIGADRENKVVILTGAGESFCAEIDFDTFGLGSPEDFDHLLWEGRRMLGNLLDIEVPMISVVNGPARFHPEIPVLCDIVLASETASFQDGPHFPSGIVPGDGAHVVWPHVLGPNRGRYFLISGQELDAQTALEYGAVNEVLPKDKVMARAQELAAEIAAKPELTRRYTRVVLTEHIKRLMQESIGYGLAVEGLAAVALVAATKDQ